MTRRARIVSTLPKPAVDELRKLGAALRTARLARNETQAQLARRLGIALRTVAVAEQGHPGVSSGVLIAMMWSLGLGPVGDSVLAQASKSALAAGGKVRARRGTSKALDDF